MENNGKNIKKQKIHLFLAKPRGFCAGVERAIQIVERALEKHGAPIYVRHEIVHNKYVVDRLRQMGAIFVKELNEVPTSAIAIFSAHGVSDSVEDEAKKTGLRVIDATCPLVKKVHNRAIKYDSEGRTMILVGHQNHPETQGTMGRIKGKVYLVQSVEDVDLIDLPESAPIGYVTQTTLSVDDTKQIVDKIYQRFADVLGPELRDICYATQNRQNAVKFLADNVDLILVIGSNNSSNSNRLRDIAQASGVDSYLIDSTADIKEEWLEGIKKIGITAGASAPELLVEQVVEYFVGKYNTTLEEIEGIDENIFFRLPPELLPVE